MAQAKCLSVHVDLGISVTVQRIFMKVGMHVGCSERSMCVNVILQSNSKWPPGVKFCVFFRLKDIHIV